MSTPAPSPFQPLAVWAWRLLPFFALVAAVAAWKSWHSGAEDEFAIRSSLQARAPEWECIQRITGKALGH